MASFYAVFYISQAVPIFFIIYGITTSISISKKTDKSFWRIFNKDYFLKKAKRYYVPFLPFCILSIVYTHTIHYNAFDIIVFSKEIFLSLLGIFPPHGGPGDYFVSDLIQLIVLAPVLYITFRKSPVIFLIVAILTNIVFELIAPYFPDYEYMYRRCVIRYLSAIALGLYISEDYLKNNFVNLREKKHCFVIPLFLFSFFCLIHFNGSSIPFFRSEWGTQNVLSFFYPLVIVVILLNHYKYLFKIVNKTLIELIQTIGKASYHIFTFQIAYFVFISSHIHKLLILGKNVLPLTMLVSIMIVANLIFTIFFGYLFYKVEPYLFNQLERSKKILIQIV